MNSQLIRAFADYLSDVAEEYRVEDRILNGLIENAVIELHSIAHTLKEKEDVIKSSKTSGKQ